MATDAPLAPFTVGDLPGDVGDFGEDSAAASAAGGKRLRLAFLSNFLEGIMAARHGTGGGAARLCPLLGAVANFGKKGASSSSCWL